MQVRWEHYLGQNNGCSQTEVSLSLKLWNSFKGNKDNRSELRQDAHVRAF